MGLFDTGGGGEADRIAQLQEEEMNLNKAELADKRDSLYQTTIGIIGGQGAQQWSSSMRSPIRPPSAPRSPSGPWNPASIIPRIPGMPK